MDFKSVLVIGLVYLITWILMIKIEMAEGMCASYFVAIYFLTWIPGVFALVFSRLEGFKIPIFKGANSFFFRVLLLAMGIGVCIIFSPNIMPANERVGNISFILLYPIVILIGAVQAIGETVFWWGYIYKKLEHLHPIKTLLSIGVLWGLWHAPLILMVSGYIYDAHRVTGLAMMPLFTLAISPLMFYFRRRGRCVLVPAIFYCVVNFSDFLLDQCCHNNNDLIEGIHGLPAIEVLFACSCVALFLLWREGAFKRHKNAFQ